VLRALLARRALQTVLYLRLALDLEFGVSPYRCLLVLFCLAQYELHRGTKENFFFSQ
jgi:hypothetical protein